MQGIYSYIPETKYVNGEYSVAAILLLLFMVLISLVSVLNLLYFYISIFRSMCAVPNMAVFCSSLTSCFPCMFIIIVIIIIIILQNVCLYGENNLAVDTRCAKYCMVTYSKFERQFLWRTFIVCTKTSKYLCEAIFLGFIWRMFAFRKCSAGNCTPIEPTGCVMSNLYLFTLTPHK